MPDPALNIRSEITRIRGVAQSPGVTGAASGNAALIGPVPLTQLLANALSAIQDFCNTAGQRITGLTAQIVGIGSISAKAGTISFSGCTVTITVDQSANQLLFAVKYSDGTQKSGAVALT